MRLRNERGKSLEDIVGAVLEVPMIFLTLLLIPVMAIPALYPLSPLQEKIFQYADNAIWVAFFIELFLKLLVSKNYPRTIKRNWFLVIILLLPAFRIFRLARIARFLGIIRLLRLQPFVNHLKRNIRVLIYNLEYITIALVLIILIASFSMWQIEQRSGGEIDSFGKALWWSVITITTVGYGDVVPTSPTGKIFAGVISLFGIILFMLVVARITALFVRSRADTYQNKVLVKLVKRVEELEKKK